MGRSAHRYGMRPRSWDRPLSAFRGGFRGAGASSTASTIAANIERGFGPKKRSAAVVPSGRVRRKVCMAVKHARLRGRSSPRSCWLRRDKEPLRPSTVARERWNTAASRLASSWRWCCASGLNALQTPPGSTHGARSRSASARRGSPSLTGRVPATRSREYEGISLAGRAQEAGGVTSR
jgi:hypothetical protein